MPNIDLLIGLRADKLNAALAQAFKNPSVAEKIFSGAQTGSFEGVSYTASYKLNTAPLIDLRPPTPDEWKNSIKEGGNPGSPVANAFIVELPALAGSFSSAGVSKNSVFALKAICNASNSGGKVVLRAYSVVIDLSHLSPIDKFATIKFLVPKILSAVNATLSGVAFPIPSFAGISLTPPAVAIESGVLLIAFNMVNHPMSGLQGIQTPNHPLFVLASPGLVQTAASYMVTHNIQGQSFNKSGSQGGGGFSAGYEVSGSVRGIHVQTTVNPMLFHATVDLGLTASAGIDTPLGYVVKGGQLIYEGLKTVGETVGNAMNPTNW